MFGLRTNILICLLGLMACGYISVFLGKDLSWDLANYHYYNAYAFLNQRYGLDYWPPSFIQAFFTPTLDFLAYYLINHFSPIMTTFMMGFIHGFNFWLVFAICYLALDSYEISHKKLKAFLLALAGLYGPMALPGMGSFQQDNTVSICVLAFVLLQFKFLSQNNLMRYQRRTLSCRPAVCPRDPEQSPPQFLSLDPTDKPRDDARLLLLVIGNFLLGIAAGLKLTAGIFIVGNLLSLFWIPTPWPHKLKILTIASLSIASGLILTSGYWMLFLWQKYHNPVFPFFNSIFHSPYYSLTSWHDTRFLPHHWLQAIFFPFYFSWNHQTNELPFLDFRFAILYLALIGYGCFRLVSASSQTALCKTDTISAEKWVFSFFICSYLLWEYYFSVMRYLVALEMLTPLAIYLILIKIFKTRRIRNASLSLLLILIFVPMSPAHTIRAPWYGGSYFNVELPSEINKGEAATVLVPYSAYALYLNPRPQSYLIPFFPKKWRFIGIPFWENRYEIASEIDSALKQNKGHAFYILTPANYLPLMLKIASIKKLYPVNNCKAIGSDRQKITSIPVMLCQMNKNLSH